MSKNLSESKWFVGLLIDNKTPNKQKKSLIHHISASQLNAVSEIVLNIIQGNVKIDKKLAKLIKKHFKILNKLTKKGTSFKQKQRVLLRNFKVIALIFHSIRKVLYEILKL